MVSRVAILLLSLASVAIVAAEPTPTPSPSPTPWPPTHRILLATLSDTDEQLAIVDKRAFRSVDTLKQYLVSLPRGDSFYFATWDRPPGQRENKFVSAAEDLKKFCNEHGIALHLKPIPPHF